MTEWLVATLAAPLASFGEAPGNVRRGTADRPTRSALLGLAGAALGLERSDSEGQDALRKSFGVATRTLRRGTLLIDFHTFQSLPTSRDKVRTRAEALNRKSRLKTSLTYREYRTDVCYQIAFREKRRARLTLKVLQQAMAEPMYAPYAGRRSCPLSRPLSARIIVADDVLAAFSAHPDASDFVAGTSLVAAEAPRDFGDLRQPLRSRRRTDEPGSRVTWQFSSRLEYEYAMPLDQDGGNTEPRK